MFNKIYGNIGLYQKALDGAWERNKVISNNIANVNTPKFKRKEVLFEDQLKLAIDNKKVDLKTTNIRHIKKARDGFSPIVVTDHTLSHRLDGNNVNIDTESANLAKNTIVYDALTRQITGDFEKIKNVISEGSK